MSEPNVSEKVLGDRVRMFLSDSRATLLSIRKRIKIEETRLQTVSSTMESDSDAPTSTAIDFRPFLSSDIVVFVITGLIKIFEFYEKYLDAYVSPVIEFILVPVLFILTQIFSLVTKARHGYNTSNVLESLGKLKDIVHTAIMQTEKSMSELT